MVNPTITTLSGIELDAPLQTTNLPFLPEIGGVKLSTLSFSNSDSDRFNNGASPLPNKYRPYPYSNYLLSMIDTNFQNF